MGRNARLLLSTVLFLSWTAVRLPAAGPEDGLVYRLAFDGNLQPSVGQEWGMPKGGGNPKFVEGRFGQAVELKDGAHVIVPLAASAGGNVSISFWVKPLWHPDDNLPHPILEIPAKEKQDDIGWPPGPVFLSKGWSETIAPGHLYGAVDPGIGLLHLRPDRWTHVLLVYSADGKFAASYFDGEGSKLPSKDQAAPGATTLWLGTRAGGGGFGNVVIDDLRIYNRAISQDEIPAVAGASFPPPRDYSVLGNACDPAKSVETPHTEWAKPYAGGRSRVLFITQDSRSRDIVELAQRVDVEPVLVQGPTLSPQILISTEPFQRMGREIEAALAAGRTDCVVVAVFGWNLLPDSTRTAILENTKNGGGLLFVCPLCAGGPGANRNAAGGLWIGWENMPLGQEIEKLVHRLDRADEEYLTTVIPWDKVSFFRPTLTQRSPASLFRGGTLGKGRVLIYDIGEELVYRTCSLVPDIAYTEGFSFDALDYDYALGPAAKAVLWASGRDSAVKITDVSYGARQLVGPQIAIGTRGAWAVDVTNTLPQPVRVEVTLTARTRGYDQPFAASVTASLAPGMNRVSLPHQVKSFGTVFGDVRVVRDKKVADWATGTVEVARSNPGFLDLAADASAYEAGQSPTVTGRCQLTRYGVAAGEKGQIAWRLYDCYGRMIAQGSPEIVFSPYDEFSVGVAWKLPPLPEYSLVYQLVADMVYRGNTSDQRTLMLKRRIKDVDDFAFFSWQGGGGDAVTSLATLVMRDRYGMVSGGAGGLGRPSDDPRFLAALDWQVAHNIRPWIYATHLGGSAVNAKGERTIDMADPDYLKELAGRMEQMAQVVEPYSPLFYSLGDEVTMGDPAAQPTEHEQQAFRAYLKQRFGTVAALNKAWNTTFSSWEELTVPPREALQKGTGQIPPGEVMTFREWLFADMIGAGVAGARKVAPHARVGIEGIFGLTINWTGEDYWKMTRASTLLGQYAVGSMEMDMVRSFQKPGDLLGCWYNYLMLDRGYSLYGPWHFFLKGGRAFGWFTTVAGGQYSALNLDFTPFDQFAWTWEELQPLLAGIGKLGLGLTRDDTGVTVLYEQRNLERTSPQFLSMLCLTTLLDDIGIQHTFISGEEVAAGQLAARKTKLLLLVGQSVMSEPVARAIQAYVQAGGAVLADVVPGQSNGAIRYPKPLLADLFAAAGTTPARRVGKGRSFLIGNYVTTYRRERTGVQGEQYRKLVAGVVADCGVRPAASLRAVDGSFVPVTMVSYHDGDAIYVGLQRDYTVADQAPRDIEVTVARPVHVYDVRGGRYLGQGAKGVLTLEPARGAMLAFLPYEVKSIALPGLAQTYQAGTSIRCTPTLACAGGTPAHGVFRVEVTGPGGKRISALCGKPRWTAGKAALDLPLAFNDPKGDWKISVTDVATGVRGEQSFQVQ